MEADGILVDNFSRIQYTGIVEEIRKIMTELQCELEQFNDRIIFNDIVWGERGNIEKCETNSVTVVNYARRFLLGRWSFLGPGSEKTWYGTYFVKPDGDWDKTAERMMLNLAESGHPIFRATSALERGESAQYLRSRSGFVWRIIPSFRSSRETCSE